MILFQALPFRPCERRKFELALSTLNLRFCADYCEICQYTPRTILKTRGRGGTEVNEDAAAGFGWWSPDRSDSFPGNQSIISGRNPGTRLHAKTYKFYARNARLAMQVLALVRDVVWCGGPRMRWHEAPELLGS